MTTQMIPFDFEGKNIRVVADENGEPLFVGKDICLALGYADPSRAMVQHCRQPVKYRPLQTTGGMQEVRVLTEGDMFRLIVNCKLPAAEAFERLVFEEILPAIRKTGRYEAPSAKQPSEKQDSTEALKLIPIAVRAARFLGLDRNAAVISANQAVKKMTGADVMALLGHTHLVNEQQELFFTPSQLGERLGVSGREFNKRLAEVGYQAKVGDCWKPLEPALGCYRLLDTGKRHSDGQMVQQLKWSFKALEAVQKLEEQVGV